MADIDAVGTQEEVRNAVDFSFTAFMSPLDLAKRDTLLKKVESLKTAGSEPNIEKLHAYLSPEELGILESLRAKKTALKADIIDVDNFTSDTIDGRAINMVQGSLGLVAAT